VEQRTYEDVSKLAAAFSLNYSKWNQAAGVDKCVLRIKETLDYDEDPSDIHETDWRCVMVRRVVCCAFCVRGCIRGWVRARGTVADAWRTLGALLRTLGALLRTLGALLRVVLLLQLLRAAAWCTWLFAVCLLVVCSLLGCLTRDAPRCAPPFLFVFCFVFCFGSLKWTRKQQVASRVC